MSLLRFDVSHTEKLPRWHCSHWPQKIVNGTTMPVAHLEGALASGPTSTTSPMNSWPMMSPFFMPGMKPS
jgi:hypothetical protein